MIHITRRQLLKTAGASVLGAGLPLILRGQDGPTASAAETTDASPLPETTRLNRYSRSVQDYYVRKVREVEQAGNARRAALRTKADAERYIEDVRQRWLNVFGPFPEKTPLNARVTAVHERDGYKIENVLFESRPGFVVAANLYVPTNRSGALPGVVGCCGHSDSGKAGVSYQMFAQGLARQGFLTLIFDPMGQGERLQYVNDQLKPKFGVGTSEHTYSGVRMVLAGENLGRWFVWDGIRAIDYLLSRPEVDPKRIGVTGNSGGGGQATWLCAVDRRITMAAPSCFVTTIRRNIENENSQDPEQFPPRMLEFGLDHSDAIAAMAPKPVKILGQELDYFDARGFEEAAARLRHLYRLLGAEDNFDSFLGDDYHGFSKPNREAMYGWFNRQAGLGSGSTEPNLIRERPETLRCTPGGQVAAIGSWSEFSWGRDRSRLWRASRKPLAGAELKKALATMLALPERVGAPDYQILRWARTRGYSTRAFATYVIETEPGIPVVAVRLNDASLLSRIPRGPKRAVLYIAHASADVEMREDGWLREICRENADAAIFACDLRGVGESKPLVSTPENPAKGGSDYFHAGCGLLFNYPTAGQRAHDVLRVLDLLQETGHDEIHLVARGWGAIPAAFAAVVHDRVTRVTLKQALTSYSDIAESETYRWPLSALVPGILPVFDLPDCYRELKNKGLTLIEPASAEGVPR